MDLCRRAHTFTKQSSLFAFIKSPSLRSSQCDPSAPMFNVNATVAVLWTALWLELSPGKSLPVVLTTDTPTSPYYLRGFFSV